MDAIAVLLIVIVVELAILIAQRGGGPSRIQTTNLFQPASYGRMDDEDYDEDEDENWSDPADYWKHPPS